MKILNIVLLTVFFLIICVSLTKSFLNTNEHFENSDRDIEDEREKCTNNESTNKSDDEKDETITKDISLNDESTTQSISLKDLTSEILEHPATDTDKKLKKQYVRPININVSYNVEKDTSKCVEPVKSCEKPEPKCVEKCWPHAGDYITGTVTNRFITTGYGSQTSLGSGPVRLEFTDEYTVPKREFVNSSKYRQLGTTFGSTDNAKIPMDIFVDEDENSYTILKDKYISFPQERYSVTDLANMNK